MTTSKTPTNAKRIIAAVPLRKFRVLAKSQVLARIDEAWAGLHRQKEMGHDWTGAWTYFIQDSGGNVKVGRSKNPAKRLESLQTSNAEALKLLATIPADLEADIHALLASSRIRQEGEWFYQDGGVLDLVWTAVMAEG